MPNGPDPPSSDPVIPTGTVLFGEYEVLGVLGGGGMGHVYKARHRSLGTLRALKVVRPDLGMDSRAEEMFVREAKALMEIHHDAIVRCHDLLRDDRQIYLVMELVEGPSLQRLLLRGPLPDDEVVILLRRVMAGLGAIHGAGIVHRDISPANIILPNGEPEKAKLIDFGIAADDAGQQAKGFKGNLTYASPEQFGLYGGRVTAQSDLYSLGLVLAEAAMGEPLLPAQSYFEAREMRKTRPVLPEYLPADLRSKIAPLLEPDPRNRSAEARVAAAEEDSEEAPAGASWLQSAIFTATSAGVGLGIGISLWLWQYATP